MDGVGRNFTQILAAIQKSTFPIRFVIDPRFLALFHNLTNFSMNQESVFPPDLERKLFGIAALSDFHAYCLLLPLLRVDRRLLEWRVNYS